MGCFLSIIIPAHNEERRLSQTLESLLTFLQAQPYPSEVVLVENDSQDRTLALAQSYAARYANLRILSQVQRGKGLAIRRGMLAAEGEYRFMCDADFSMPIDQIERFLPPALAGVDVAIASREAPGAVRYNEPIHRHIIGRFYNFLIRQVALPGLNDTQCGFKCFRAAVAQDVFSLQTITGWSFDVEVLYIARLLGYGVVEVPIPWYYNGESKIDVWRDSLRMGLDLWKIRRNAQRGIYARGRIGQA